MSKRRNESNSPNWLTENSVYVASVAAIIGVFLLLSPTCVREQQISGFLQPYAATCIESVWTFGQGQAVGLVCTVISLLLLLKKR